MAKEIKRKMVQYQIDIICECGGYFYPLINSMMYFRTANNKLQIEHKCNKCGKKEIFETAYPTTETVLEEI